MEWQTDLLGPAAAHVFGVYTGWGDLEDPSPAEEKGSNVQLSIPNDRHYNPVTGDSGALIRNEISLDSPRLFRARNWWHCRSQQERGLAFDPDPR